VHQDIWRLGKILVKGYNEIWGIVDYFGFFLEILSGFLFGCYFLTDNFPTKLNFDKPKFLVLCEFIHHFG